MVDILSQESGKEVQEEEDMYTIMAHSYLLYGRNHHNTVKQLPSN